jgi:hypothetical protein
MSGEHAKREMVIEEKLRSSGKKIKERTPSKEVGDKHKEESTGSIKSHKKGDKKKKKMKKVVYYETDSSSPSTSERAPLLFVALGKPLYFNCEDYCMWSDKMRHHLTSLHESI